jgi:hypothetical protein
MFFFSISLIAEVVDRIYGTTFKTMKEHEIYKSMVQNAETFKRKMKDHPYLDKAMQFVSGKSSEEFTDHYAEIAEFMAENMSAGHNNGSDNDFGTGSNGSIAARTYITEKDLFELEKLAPTAFKNYEASGAKMSWQEWVKQFEGDTPLALKAIILRNGWALNGLKLASKNLNIPIRKLELVSPYSTAAEFGQKYAMYPLAKDAFGADFSSSRNYGDRDLAEKWGSAYKAVGGMNLALAGRYQGYSDHDIKMMVSRSALLNESSDLLYDHLGFQRSGLNQVLDNPNKSLQPTFLDFIPKSKKKLEQNPDLLKKMMASTLSYPSVGRFIPDSFRPNTEDDLILVFLMMNYQYENPKKFEKEFGKLFSESKEGKDLKNLFRSGIIDTTKMVKGAEFVLEKLPEESASQLALAVDCEGVAPQPISPEAEHLIDKIGKILRGCPNLS